MILMVHKFNDYIKENILPESLNGLDEYLLMLFHECNISDYHLNNPSHYDYLEEIYKIFEDNGLVEGEDNILMEYRKLPELYKKNVISIVTRAIDNIK